MIIQIGTNVDESRILWKHKESDEWKRADIDDLIRAYEDSERTGEWIPVSERLPSEHEEVLISVRKDNGWGHVTSANFHNEKASTFFGGYDIKEVVAWQPLPEPYKGGDAE